MSLHYSGYVVMMTLVGGGLVSFWGPVIGTVAFFHRHRGFGFIDGDHPGTAFLHQSNVASKVARGQRVEYALRQGPKGLEAVDVVAV